MIVVTNLNDSGAGSLRAAIAAAAVGEEITFSVTGTITLTSAQLTITQSVIITGPGSGSLTISGGGTFRVFQINGGIVTISGIRIFNGSGDFGGGMNNDSGTVTLEDIIVNFCSATDEGGGIYNESTISAGNLTVSGCSCSSIGGGVTNRGTFSMFVGTINGSISNGEGSGIYNDGTCTVEQVSITTNQAITQPGGGVYNLGTIDLTECSITNNTSVGGGMAISNVFGTVTVTRCCVSSHIQASSNAIQNDSGTINLLNSTVSTNTTGLFNNGGSFDIQNSTIVLNDVGMLNALGSVFTIYDTILSGNNTTDYDGATADAISIGNNIFGVNTNPITPATGDQTVLTFAALVMGGLQNNGGITSTHALLEGSPAIDAGNNTGAPANDQRGFGYPRIIDGTIDIGSFESDIEPIPPEPPVPPTPVNPPSPQFPPTPPTQSVVPPGTWTCPIPPSPCARPDEPTINTSSEDPDPVTFASGMTFGFIDWDPGLNKGFAVSFGCGQICHAPTQEEADACAQALANSCTQTKNPEPDPNYVYTNGGGGTPIPPIPVTVPKIVLPLFGNHEYTAYGTCPDGTVVSYTVVAGRFTDNEQALADQKAKAFGDMTVIVRKWCITPISPLHCFNQPISGSFRASGYNPQFPIRPYPISLLSGSYPPGVSFSQFTPGVWTATGTPTQLGLYTFTVQITNGDGTIKESTMNILVWGITTSLPDPVVNAPYSEQLVSTGGHDSVSYEISSGQLPTGLNMTKSGLISGTPTESGSFLFVVKANAENSLGSGSCSRQYTLDVIESFGCPTLFLSSPYFAQQSVGYSGAAEHVWVPQDSPVQVMRILSGADGSEITTRNYPNNIIFNMVWASAAGRMFATSFVQTVPQYQVKHYNDISGVEGGIIATDAIMLNAYDETQNYIYYDSFGDMFIVDASTLSAVSTIPGVFNQPAIVMSSNRIYVGDTGSGIRIFNPDTAVLIGTIAHSGTMKGSVYAPIANRVVSILEDGGNGFALFINPDTDTIESTLALPDVPYADGRLTPSVSPNTGLVYLSGNGFVAYVLDPANGTLVCELAAVTVYSSAFSTTYNRLWTPGLQAYDE